MQFTVTWARYSQQWQRLEFAASGERNGARFTVVTHVKCREPKTAENTHLVAMMRIIEVFKLPSASGR
ncbi:MAG: hypothetical protein JWR51_1262 [Devosia sp.]|uniref:hypothetical protein n=1 Tax=Devosia sp. TaxID=1871048 RepID=UPI00262CE919|nr:hypothetical protein [Devosia sp.]MDB5528159.1 hypothetical protein [Devosia sp.]